ncbi:MAG: hypothetical protein DHS20C16_03630 [Phycisphaerae bacterium]|nr:MAG: hypothetical protein DHS20C16_03630 [Phycisphaerae bacterium]
MIKLEDCNAEFNRLHQNLQDVESANWPQKAATLEIDLNACNEKHALLLARHKDASALHDETTDALRHEIQLLETGNVPVTLPEFDDLLNEHISLKQKHAELKHENSKCIQQSKALQAQVEAERSTNERYRKLAASAIVSNNPSASKETKILIATVRGIGSDSERAKAIKNGLRAMHRRISAADLSSMIAGMRWSGDRRDALVGAAPYLNYPVPRRVIASFTSGLSSGDKSDVLEAFVYHGNQAAGGR